MLRPTVILLVSLLAFPLLAVDRTDRLLERAWPNHSEVMLEETGRGIGIVFSPDLSVPGNCRFYESLGFACFEDTDWSRVLERIKHHNVLHPTRSVRTLLLETHGTNGHGLRLQKSKEKKAERSYISVGALQERLEPHGVRYIIISACNSGRLLRPMILRTLDSDPGDKMFLPATCGIIGASGSWNPRRSRVTVITPATSQVETSLVASVRELAPATRNALKAAASARGVKPPGRFAVSDLLMQILLRDSALALRTRTHVETLSKEIQPQASSEALFRSFVKFLNARAAEQKPSLVAAKQR